MAVSMTVVVLAVTNTNRSIFFRLAPALILGPFMALYNNHAGMYGVHRSINTIISDMAQEREDESQVRHLTQ